METSKIETTASATPDKVRTSLPGDNETTMRCRKAMQETNPITATWLGEKGQFKMKDGRPVLVIPAEKPTVKHTDTDKPTASASQNRAIAKDAALIGLPTLRPKDMPTAAQRRKWAKEYRDAQDGALKLIPAAQRTIPAEKPTAEPVKPRNYDDAMVEDLAKTHANTLTKLDKAQAQAAQLAEALRELQNQSKTWGTIGLANPVWVKVMQALSAYESEVGK